MLLRSVDFSYTFKGNASNSAVTCAMVKPFVSGTYLLVKYKKKPVEDTKIRNV